VNSTDRDEEADKFLSTAGHILQKGGFKLHKFQSNSGNLKIHREDEVVHKVLGISWHVKRDEFLPSASFQPVLKRCTKREIASLMVSIYDPLGLAYLFLQSSVFF